MLSKSYDNRFFGGNREKVILRDGEKCVKCSLTRKSHLLKYGKDITVDHIDGNGTLVPRGKRNNKLENLQTLCSKCHFLKDYRGKKEQFTFTTFIDGGSTSIERRLKSPSKVELKIIEECFL